MSFYSSIVLFRPGRSYQIRLHELRSICDNLRATFNLEDDYFSANIRFESTCESASHILWNEVSTIGTVNKDLEDKIDWQHEKGSWTWQQVWPEKSLNDQIVFRANVHLGSLSDLAIKELSCCSEQKTSPCDISITEMSISIGPAWIGELTGELPENECYGCMAVSLSGYGYFTWQPLATYWKYVGRSATLRKAMEICKDVQPAPLQINVSLLKERLGDVFLNHEEYQSGDWIVSVSESG